MKVAIYVRVSTEEQKLENQTLRLKEYAVRNDWEFEMFFEKESTRKTRPVKNELYLRLLRKEFDALLIYKFDRWARSTVELVNDIETLVSKGVAIYSYTEAIDLNSTMGNAMMKIISVFAELERKIIRERTLAGLARAKAQGKTLGRPKGSKDKKVRKKGGYYLRYKTAKSNLNII